MLNPDGVIAGNFRTSYSGKDLNRQFNKLNKYIFPEITALDKLVREINAYQGGLHFYMDFHGHSVKKGLFCYGPEHPVTKTHYFKCRAFAKLVEQAHPIFSYKNSIFSISEHKKTTARAHMLWKMKIPMSFTFEVSNGLYDDKKKQTQMLTRSTLLEAGGAVYDGFYRYVQLEMTLFRNVPDKRNVQSSKSQRYSRNKSNMKRNSREKSKKKLSNNNIDSARTTQYPSTKEVPE